MFLKIKFKKLVACLEKEFTNLKFALKKDEFDREKFVIIWEFIDSDKKRVAEINEVDKEIFLFLRKKFTEREREKILKKLSAILYNYIDEIF